jgi:hypothetical protein
VTRIEVRLQELGFYPGPIDDAFGGGVERGVQQFQAKAGLSTTGIVDPVTWASLFQPAAPQAPSLAEKPLAYRCLALTAAFETEAGVPDCFCGLAGSFDGQGISLGVLQWNLGQGTLQPLLKRMDAEHTADMKVAFGDGYAAVHAMLAQDKPAQLAWAAGIQDDKHHVVEPWRSRFKALGRVDSFQQMQVDGANDRFQQGLKMCAAYGVWSERAAALMFDIVVQNGSIKDATKAQIQADFAALPSTLSREDAEVARLRIVANRRAEAANPKFVEDVRSRKLAIAEGKGKVHGMSIDLATYGIRLVPFG